MGSTIVTLPYDSEKYSHSSAVDWAKKNCPSYITNDVHRSFNPEQGLFVPDIDHIDYFFSCERDAALFTLRWL